MKSLFAFLVFALVTSFSFVADAKGPPTPQQQLMVSCNKYWHVYMKEHNLKGKDRKTYLSDCLSGDITVPNPSSRSR
jgi:hypothetical protein